MKKHLLAIILISISFNGFAQIGYTFNGANNTSITSSDLKNKISNLNGLTVEFWAKMSSLDNQSFINITVPSLPANAGGFSFLQGKMAVSLSTDYGSFTQSNDISSSIVTNTWNHFAYVFNNGIWSFYLNGINVGSLADQEVSPSTFDYASLGATYFEFGKVQTPNSYTVLFKSLTGAMDEIRIWNTARTVTNISSNKDTELTGAETGLILYHKLNETSGQIVLDSSPSNLNSVLGSTSSIETSDPVINQTGIVTNPVLPVELVKFDLLQSTNGEVVITWKTASEKENSHFEILKSDDGKNFKFLSSVNSSKIYSVTDRNPYNGISYYQLVQYDLNGDKSILSTKSVKSVFEESIKVYPNPTTDFVNLFLNNSDFTKVSLTDVKGNILETIEIKKETKLLKFDISRFTNGIYFVNLTGDGKVKTLKVLRTDL
ncbi:LamG-like jellyroll fold domain-containing protein [Pedobacter alpinus]|uniref:LamG-like jellyroll fold domain-containing protein n=1 Tax=Pedobacter alpinus TaxID=1590643 RepID=A0ABW5TMQ5_9SPHI